MCGTSVTMYGMQVYFKIEKFEKLGPVKDAKPCMPLALFDKTVNLGIVRHKHYNFIIICLHDMHGTLAGGRR